MPKISIQGQPETSFQIQSSISKNINRLNRQYVEQVINTNSKSFYKTVVPIYEVNYNPQFSKSPLASLQIQRKEVFEPEFQTSQKKSHAITINYEKDNRKFRWKTILKWIGTIVAILVLIIGLYFLVDAILGHKKPSNEKQSNTIHLQPKNSAINIKPIYVSPILSNDLPKESLVKPVTIKNQQSSKLESNSSSNDVTYPSVQPLYPITVVQNFNSKNSSQPILPIPTTTVIAKTDSDLNINYNDFFQNSIEPINVYQKS